MTAPAGWYPDGTGHLRWRDGTAWTAHCTAPPPRTSGMPPAFFAVWAASMLVGFAQIAICVLGAVRANSQT